MPNSPRPAGSQADLGRLLDAMAVTPRLDGLLVYGAGGDLLAETAGALEERLRGMGLAVDRVWLGSADGDDDLWGAGEALPAEWRRRALLRPPDGAIRIVMIGDLSRLSLAAARAALALLGGEPAHIERRGESALVLPRLRWIAGLGDDDVAEVSPHLLDRFAFRVRAPTPAGDRVILLQANLTGSSPPGQRDRDSARLIAAAAGRCLRVRASACAQALAAAGRSVPGHRREIALLRLGEALARLAGARVVTAEHVVDAAAVLGADVGRLPMTPDAARDLPTAGPASERPAGTAAPAAEAGVATGALLLAEPGEHDGPGRASVRKVEAGSGDTIIGDETAIDRIGLPSEPALEPDARRGREFASLRLPWRRGGGGEPPRGPIVGTRRALALEDLAVVETLLAAAPFQRIRRDALGARDLRAMIVMRRDLRAHRRAPVAQRLLVLVIDYTSVAERAWHDAIVPYLADAYTARAELCLVRVGADDAREPLRADRVYARSILVPAIARALDAGAGTATPLADGLELARRTIQRALAQGRSAIRDATLVVLSDGRGNIPLEASRDGALRVPVGRRGIDDALRVARELRAVPHLQRVVIDPRPDVLAGLPRMLAASLGAELVTLDARAP